MTNITLKKYLKNTYLSYKFYIFETAENFKKWAPFWRKLIKFPFERYIRLYGYLLYFAFYLALNKA